ncbi:MAG: pyridoxal 5'-phosphate synthase glutaminase subunit PdxT [Synergistetes bacterium]|nr:pyridoxal 5'-phosphate synthase glutaminase subunit PdxT [Synergistota bacterium]
MRIGVLAVQGAVSEHIEAISKALKEMNLKGEVFPLRRREDLQGLRGLIIPGGESTTIFKLLLRDGLFDELKDLILNGLAVMGTCAGIIMLAKEIEGGIEGQRGFSLLNIRVSRNAYGRQVDSFEAPLKLSFDEGEPFRGVFIRAPRILRLYEGVKPLAFLGEEVVGVEQGNLIGLTFHPELTDDTRLHRYFLEKALSF